MSVRVDVSEITHRHTFTFTQAFHTPRCVPHGGDLKGRHAHGELEAHGGCGVPAPPGVFLPVNFAFVPRPTTLRHHDCRTRFLCAWHDCRTQSTEVRQRCVTPRCRSALALRMGRRRPPRHGRPKAWLGCWPRLVRAPCGARTNVGLPLTPCAALARSLRRASLVEEHRESSYEVRRALFSLLLPRPAPSHGSCRPRALPLPLV